MNTKVLIGIIFGIVAVALGFWFMSGGERGEVALDSAPQESASVGKTFAELLGMGQSLKCSYEYNDGGNVS